MSESPLVLPYLRPLPAIDPEAKFHACKTLRVLGPFCTVAGFGPALMFLSMTLWSPAHADGIAAMLLFTSLFWLIGLSGVTYWLCAGQMRHNSRTAALVALILAFIHLGFFMLWFLVTLAVALSGSWLAIMPLIMSLLFMLGLADLIRNLRRCAHSFTHLPNAV